jgi:hypothetical protein
LAVYLLFVLWLATALPSHAQIVELRDRVETLEQEGTETGTDTS